MADPKPDPARSKPVQDASHADDDGAASIPFALMIVLVVLIMCGVMAWAAHLALAPHLFGGR